MNNSGAEVVFSCLDSVAAMIVTSDGGIGDGSGSCKAVDTRTCMSISSHTSNETLSINTGTSSNSPSGYSSKIGGDSFAKRVGVLGISDASSSRYSSKTVKESHVRSVGELGLSSTSQVGSLVVIRTIGGTWVSITCETGTLE